MKRVARPARPPSRLAAVCRAGRFAVLVLAAALAWPFAARAEDATDLRGKIVTGDAAARAAALKQLEGRPTQIVEVLGPVLRALDARPAAVAVAAWLAERSPSDPEPPLLDEVVRRAEADPEFARAVALAASPSGWGRVVEGARTRAKGTTTGLPAEAVRRGAVALLAADPKVASMLDVVDVWACDAALSVRTAARAALVDALAYAFADPEAARAWLAPRTATPFLDVVRALSARKDTPEHPAYQRLVDESRASIERTTTLDKLAPYLRPRSTPWPEVRRIAARQAIVVRSTEEEWRVLLGDLLRDEDDRDALASLLQVFSRFGDASTLRSKELADAVLLRMRACCNAPALMRGLLDLLAKVGGKDAMLAAREEIVRASDPSLELAWIGAAAAVGGLEEVLCRMHQSRADADDELSLAIRVKVIESLALHRSGEWTDRAVAQSYLYGILRRDDGDAIVATMPKETAPAARAAAIRSLESFPDPGTYDRLVRLSASPPELPEHAVIAVSVLAKLAARDPVAVRSLVAVAGDAATSANVRVEALVDAAKLAADPAAGPEARAAVLPVVRAAAEVAEAATVRVAAVQAAALLADVSTVSTAVRLAAGLRKDGKPEASSAEQALSALVVALAQDATGANDVAIATALRELAQQTASLDAAVAAADETVDQGEARLELQALRASLRLERARRATDAAARRTALEEAHRILRSALKAADRATVDADVLRRALVGKVEVCEALLAEGDLPDALRRSALIAVLAATREWAAADATMRAAVLARGERWLSEAKALSNLTEDETRTVDAFETAVKAPPLPPR